MALETIIFQQDPFIYGVKDYNSTIYSYALPPPPPPLPNADHGNNWESPPSSTVALNGASTSSPETCGGGDGFFSGGGGGYSNLQQPVLVAPHAAASRRKRRRTKSMKNKEEMENQRMTHIAVERNRRRQMNDYLAVLRSLMPPSYAQRGDQASIVGGAINFVKELEQLLQFLEVQNPANQLQPPPSGGGGATTTYSGLFSKFFTFPQYSTSPSAAVDAAATTAEERRSGVADIEVTVVESHANIKLLTKRRPKQLLKLVAGFQSVYLTILHLNITAAAVDESVLYSFSVKVEDECELTTVNEIATTVHEIVGMIQQESLSS
ncbi:hypothetical protein ABFS83_08G224300 [Erythranthe nasuta]